VKYGEQFARLQQEVQLRKLFHIEVENIIIIKLNWNAQAKVCS
jgi:hypothetical protein